MSFPRRAKVDPDGEGDIVLTGTVKDIMGGRPRGGRSEPLRPQRPRSRLADLRAEISSTHRQGASDSKDSVDVAPAPSNTAAKNEAKA